jgi:uncharacterized membrane protein
MLRRLVAMALVAASAGFIAVAAVAADQPAVTGLYLTTRYPALTVKAGETATIDLSLHNYKLPPQELSLSVPDIAPGWKATILGGGQRVAAV